jgi:diguanylate cyclase
MHSEYNDTADQAAQIVRQAIPLANKYSLALNPIIYTVFYQYVGQQNPSVVSAIDALIAQQNLTQTTVQQVYLDHISSLEFKLVESMSANVGGLIHATQGAITRAEDDTQLYSNQLALASQQLTQIPLAPGVGAVLAHLQQETRNMQESSAKLRTELMEANDKIASMRLEFNRVRHESLTDPLTGLKNRRAFDQELTQLFKSALDSQEPISLVILDIDHFKHINDTYGHLLGDSVLKKMAAWLSETVRGKDIVSRIGGEEFALLLPETDLRGAASVAENIRTNIAKRILKHGERTLGTVTVSAGAAQFKMSESIETFFDRADQALYQAKRTGRNRVVIS